MAESAGSRTRAVSVTVAYRRAIPRGEYVSDAASDTDETRLMFAFTTTQPLSFHNSTIAPDGEVSLVSNGAVGV